MNDSEGGRFVRTAFKKNRSSSHPVKLYSQSEIFHWLLNNNSKQQLTLFNNMLLLRFPFFNNMLLLRFGLLNCLLSNGLFRS